MSGGGILSPQHFIHGAHILFIGSLSLMIFAIASRVTLAHGGHDLGLEQRSKALLVMMILLCLALVTRLLAPMSQSYFLHLALASCFWIGSLVAWGSVFLPKIFSRASQAS